MQSNDKGLCVWRWWLVAAIFLSGFAVGVIYHGQNQTRWQIVRANDHDVLLDRWNGNVYDVGDEHTTRAWQKEWNAHPERHRPVGKWWLSEKAPFTWRLAPGKE